MGPKLYTKKGKETNFCIRAFPIGGFVAMAGDDDDNPDVEKPEIEIPKERTLKGVHPLKRIVIMISGIAMNFLLAIIIVAITYLSIGYATESPKPIVEEVMENYPASKAGLEAGDLILKVTYENGYSTSPKTYDELSNFLAIYDGNGNIDLLVERDGEKLNLKMKPVYDEENARYMIGITSSEFEVVEVTLANCWKYAMRYISEMLKLTFMTLLGLFRGVGFDNVSGPIGIYEVTEEAVSYGYTSYLSLIAIISVNIGAFNLMPLPIFDGGRILLTIVEMIIGRPIDKKLENTIMTLSLAILLALVVYVSFKDIIKLLF